MPWLSTRAAQYLDRGVVLVDRMTLKLARPRHFL